MESEAYPLVYPASQRHWFFVARRKIIAGLLNKFFSKSEPARLLDIGGGTGGMVGALKPLGNLVGLDYSMEALSYYRQYHPIACCGDAARLPFGAETFKFVVALDVLEHPENDAPALNEIYRVLKRDGRALLSVPASRFLWGRVDDLGYHYRRRELGEKVERAGFRVIKSSYFNTLFFPIAALARRTELLRWRWTKIGADLDVPPAPVNAILTKLFAAEGRLLRVLDLSFGVSIVCIVEK